MSFGQPYILNISGCIHDGWLAIKPYNTFDKYFAYYTFLASDWYFNKAAVGTTVRNLNSERVANLPVPLPPLETQQRIVNRIESLFSKLDEAAEKVQAVIDSHEVRKQAILHKAFSGELTRKWREENGIYITDWKTLTLNDVAEYRKGPFGSSITKAMFVPKGKDTYKVYEQGNAIRKDCNYGNYYISKDKFLELSSFEAKPGDIIISCAGTIGEIYELPNNCDKGIINQALMRVRVHENVNHQFFNYYFISKLKERLIENANGTAIKNIPPLNVIKSMKINLPSLSEQKQIVNIINNFLYKEKNVLNNILFSYNTLVKIKSYILQSIFIGNTII